MSKFTELLSTKRATRIVLAEISAYNKLTNTLETLRFSTHKFATSPTDTPSNTVYRRRLSNNIRFEQSMYSSGSIGGQTVPGFGFIELANNDGALDYLADYAVDGRDLTLKMGGQDFAYTDYGVIFAGTVESVSFSTSSVKINIRDFQHLLDVPLFTQFYGGTGAWDGSSDVKGQPIPHAYGRVRNAKATVLNTSLLYYQVHHSSVQSISNVRDRGVSLTFSADYANKAALAAATVPASNYATCVAEGVFRLGSTPAGVVTCDVDGDNTGGFVSSVSDLIKRIVTLNTSVDVSMMDLTSFTDLNTVNTAVVGCFYDVGAPKVLEVLDPIANSIGAWYGFNRSGKFSVGRLDAPSGSPVASYGPNDIIPEVERNPTAIPLWQLRLNYRKNWSVMGESDLATSFLPGGVNAALMNDFIEEYRTTSPVNDSSVLTAHLLARDETHDTLLDLESDAITEANRRLGLEKVQRDMYKVTVKGKPLERQLNDVIEIRLNRYGLNAGRNFVMLGIDEDLVTGTSVLEIWG